MFVEDVCEPLKPAFFLQEWIRKTVVHRYCVFAANIRPVANICFFVFSSCPERFVSVVIPDRKEKPA